MSQNVNVQSGADMVAANSPETERPVRAGGYRALSVIAFALAAGGLFLGLLSRWVDFLAHSTLFGANEGTLDGSLVGFFIYYVKTVFDMGIGDYFNGIYTYLNMSEAALLLSALTTAAAVVISLVTAIVSFCVPKAAKNCAMTGLVAVFLGYFGLACTVFYTMRLLEDGFQKGMFDVPTLIIAGAALLCLIVAAFARRKGLALLNIILFVLTVLAVYALCNKQSLFMQLTVLGGASAVKDNLFFAISTLALAALIIFNVLVSAIRLNAKKSYVFDAVRFGLLLIAAVLAVVSNGLLDNEWTLFNTQLLSTILLMAAPLAALLLSLVVAILQASKARKEEAEEEAAALQAQPLQAQPAVRSENAYAAPAAAAVQTTPAENELKNVTVNVSQPVAEAQPPQNVTVNVHPPVYNQQPVAMPFYPMPYYPAQQPANVQQPAPAAEPAPVPAPAPAPVKAEETPMSEFERSMAALAMGMEPEPATAAAAYQPAPAPVYAQPVPAPAPAPAPVANYDASQYTYDSFINSLTPQEKNEFGDLFIANKYGDLAYLPAYVIGGDNREFFSKVFIYFGRYRSHISSALLDKLYAYVSRA